MKNIYPSSMIEVNGVHLHTVLAGPETGKPVLLLHGFPEFWGGWSKQIDDFAQAGLRVIVPDLRGYNQSDKPKGLSAYKLDVLAQDVASLVKALGYEKANVVGHDWGGVVAWAAAVLHPEIIERLVILNAPYPAAVYGQMLRHPTQLIRSLYVLYFQLPWLPERVLLRQDGHWMARLLQRSAREGSFTEEELEQYRQAWKKPGAMTSMLNYYRALLRRPVRLPARPRLAMPTLILWGSNDPALGNYLATHSAGLLENGRLVFYENATHWVQHDEAEQVNAAVLKFLG